jgi:hypothetical protein
LEVKEFVAGSRRPPQKVSTGEEGETQKKHDTCISEKRTGQVRVPTRTGAEQMKKWGLMLN